MIFGNFLFLSNHLPKTSIMFLKAVISEMQMYKLKFFDGAFLFYARPAQCKMHVKTGPSDLIYKGDNRFPPYFGINKRNTFSFK